MAPWGCVADPTGAATSRQAPQPTRPAAIEVSAGHAGPRTLRMRTPDQYGGTGGFGRPTVDHLARATAVTLRTTDGKTVSALLTR